MQNPQTEKNILSRREFFGWAAKLLYYLLCFLLSACGKNSSPSPPPSSSRRPDSSAGLPAPVQSAGEIKAGPQGEVIIPPPQDLRFTESCIVKLAGGDLVVLSMASRGSYDFSRLIAAEASVNGQILYTNLMPEQTKASRSVFDPVVFAYEGTTHMLALSREAIYFGTRERLGEWRLKPILELSDPYSDLDKPWAAVDPQSGRILVVAKVDIGNGKPVIMAKTSIDGGKNFYSFLVSNVEESSFMPYVLSLGGNKFVIFYKTGSGIAGSTLMAQMGEIRESGQLKTLNTWKLASGIGENWGLARNTVTGCFSNGLVMTPVYNEQTNGRPYTLDVYYTDPKKDIKWEQVRIKTITNLDEHLAGIGMGEGEKDSFFLYFYLVNEKSYQTAFHVYRMSTRKGKINNVDLYLKVDDLFPFNVNVNVGECCWPGHYVEIHQSSAGSLLPMIGKNGEIVLR